MAYGDPRQNVGTIEFHPSAEWNKWNANAFFIDDDGNTIFTYGEAQDDAYYEGDAEIKRELEEL